MVSKKPSFNNKGRTTHPFFQIIVVRRLACFLLLQVIAKAAHLALVSGDLKEEEKSQILLIH